MPAAVRSAPPGTRALRAFVLCVVTPLCGCGGAGPARIPPGGAGTIEATSGGEHAWSLEVLDRTNAVRAAAGLPPVVLDESASSAVYEHCWDMDVRGYFGHASPEGEGPAQRLARHGVACRVAGENLAQGVASPDDVIDEWLSSPPHRATLLHPHWTHVGVGVHTTIEGQWWGQVFYR
jgi:uncharacterized protein YkwD